MAVLFQYTKHLSPSLAFAIASGTLLVLGVVLTLLAREHKTTKVAIKTTKKGKFADITAKVGQCLKSDAGFIVAFFGAFQIRMM